MAFHWLFDHLPKKSKARNRGPSKAARRNRLGRCTGMEQLEQRALLSASIGTPPAMHKMSGPPAIFSTMQPPSQGPQSGTTATGGTGSGQTSGQSQIGPGSVGQSQTGPTQTGQTPVGQSSAGQKPIGQLPPSPSSSGQTSTAAATSFCVTLLPPGPPQQGGPQQSGGQGQGGAGGQSVQTGTQQGGTQSGQQSGQAGGRQIGMPPAPPPTGSQGGSQGSSGNSGSTQTPPIGQMLPPVPSGATVTVQVIALDATGKPTTNYSGTATVTSSDASITVPASLTFTNGVATFQVTAGAAGNDTFTVTDSTTSSIVGSVTICVVTPPAQGEQGQGGSGQSQTTASAVRK